MATNLKFMSEDLPEEVLRFQVKIDSTRTPQPPSIYFAPLPAPAQAKLQLSIYPRVEDQ